VTPGTPRRPNHRQLVVATEPHSGWVTGRKNGATWPHRRDPAVHAPLIAGKRRD
jgi:hypothetical protein